MSYEHVEYWASKLAVLTTILRSVVHLKENGASGKAYHVQFEPGVKRILPVGKA